MKGMSEFMREGESYPREFFKVWKLMMKAGPLHPPRGEKHLLGPVPVKDGSRANNSSNHLTVD